ncbi:hypothetical protein N7508_000621 [Penicillium antarcticum]|nr:uncharacterized protein N7508_000621 [Penicillium antarcticum]KAJ5320338.1 hypothetical protein N7508_000621 [Penicillium antarcticum]
MDFRPSRSSFHDFRDRRAFVRSSAAMPELSFASHGPLPIASRSNMNTAPPPLPPPPSIPDLENGYDAGWHHANSEPSTSLPPIQSNSSLLGGHRLPETASQGDSMQIDECEGRQSAPILRSPEAQINIEPPPVTEGLPSLMSINTNLTGPVLSGERDFSLRSVKDSSNAYDQHLLSKIGKPLSPRGSISLGTDNRGSQSALTVPSVASRCSSNLPSPGPSEGATLDVKWFNSPQSGGVSPRTKPGWREHIEGRSPSVESNTPSTALDYDQGSMRDIGRQRYRGTTPSREDSISLPSRSNRGSYDHGVFSDIEGEFSTDEPAPPRQFILREPTPPYPDSRQGMKRRASSPPREPMSDERHTLHVTTSNGDLSQRRTSGHPFTNTLSVNPNYPISQRTLSAASSLSIRTSGSYSSTLSIGGSSMTSLSPYDQRSPGGLSPSSDLDTYHEKSILNPSSPAALVQPTIARGLPGPASLEPPTTDATGKLSVPTTILNIPKPPASKIGGLFICDCCPKKPKKFDNPDDLRSHEMEKQYACAYCNNRFKNKNEAERHQNSLHLRRHSWSCAALVSFQAAFHASGAQSCQTNAGSSHDTCGYCGEEFPNFPSPDWDARFEHLTTVHKYGECNNAKKFFRADHFRQHLKHSHAGTSGKWTNILENACMKEEQPDKPRDQSGGGLSSNAISEVLSEQ